MSEDAVRRVSQAARRASRPADGFGGTAAGFGEAEPPCGRRPCFCWNYSRSSIHSGKPAEGVRAKNAENRAAIPLPGILLAWENPAPLIYH